MKKIEYVTVETTSCDYSSDDEGDLEVYDNPESALDAVEILDMDNKGSYTW